MSGPLPHPDPPGVDEPSIYRTLHAAYPDALLVVDPAGAIVLANPAAAALLRYSVDELTGLGIEMLVPDAVRARHAAYRSGYARNPVPRPMGSDMSLVARRRDGSEVMVEIALSPLQSHGLPYTVAAIRAIGEYPRVKQALRRARYSELLAQLGRVAVDTRDPDVLLAQVPQVAVEALDADVALVLLLEPDGLAFRVASGVNLLEGERVGDLVPNRRDTLPGQVLAQGRPIVTDIDTAHVRYAIPRSYVEAGLRHGVAVPLSDRGRIIGTLKVRWRRDLHVDAEELRFLESLSSLLATTLQRTRSEEALNHAARLESVGQLTGGIAHDFNNLLTVIQGNLQVLEDRPALAGDGQAVKVLAAAMRAARRGAELTKKLLAFSRRQVLQPTTVDVPALLDSLADMLRRTVDQRIRIEVDANGAHACRADPGQLESALLNIAINARDAMPEGGTLRFRATDCRTLPEGVEAAADAAAGYVAIAIADTGGGMSDEVRERAFEPFFTTKAAGRGTGLGLSTVYGFVKQSQGALEIESAIGAGTTVTLYIPAARTAVDAPDDASGASAVPPGLRVLLVEDDAEVRQVARRFLDAYACRVTECATAEQARARLEAGEEHDLLLSDIALGAGMRGTELAAWAQAQHPAMGVLLVSGFSRELVDADRDSPPEWELLGKPYTREELAAAIARALRH